MLKIPPYAGQRAVLVRAGCAVCAPQCAAGAAAPQGCSPCCWAPRAPAACCWVSVRPATPQCPPRPSRDVGAGLRGMVAARPGRGEPGTEAPPRPWDQFPGLPARVFLLITFPLKGWKCSRMGAGAERKGGFGGENLIFCCMHAVREHTMRWCGSLREGWRNGWVRYIISLKSSWGVIWSVHLQQCVRALLLICSGYVK